MRFRLIRKGNTFAFMPACEQALALVHLMNARNQRKPFINSSLSLDFYEIRELWFSDFEIILTKKTKGRQNETKHKLIRL